MNHVERCVIANCFIKVAFCKCTDRHCPIKVNPPGFCDSAPAEFFAESVKLSRIWKYAQNLEENDVFGLPTT